MEEAKNLIAALPPNTLTDLAARVAEALPAASLRGLVLDAVGPYKEGGAAAAASAAIASDTATLACEVAVWSEESLLRRTASELLASIPGSALKERLELYVENQGPEGLQARLVQVRERLACVLFCLLRA